MTDEEVLQHYEAMVEMFTTSLPSPIHEPKRFASYVEMYKRQQQSGTKESK